MGGREGAADGEHAGAAAVVAAVGWAEPAVARVDARVARPVGAAACAALAGACQEQARSAPQPKQPKQQRLLQRRLVAEPSRGRRARSPARADDGGWRDRPRGRRRGAARPPLA